MAPKKIKKRSKQNLSHGSGSSSESDGCKGITTNRRSERLGKQVVATCSPGIDSAYDGDGETTEESVSVNSDQVMRSVGSDAYDFEDDDAESNAQALTSYQKVKMKSRQEIKVKKKTDKKKNSYQEKSDAKIKPKIPKANKSLSTLKRSNNFSVASILKTKFDNKIVDADGKSPDKFHSDSSVKSPPLCKKENKSTVTCSKKTSNPSGTRTRLATDNTPVTSVTNSKKTSTSSKKTPVSSKKNSPVLSSSKNISKSNNKNTLSSNKKSSNTSVNKKTPAVSFSQKTLVSSVDKNTPVTSACAKSMERCTKSNASAKCKNVTTTKRKAAASSVLRSTRSPPQQNDSGMFISPPPVKVAKLSMKDTSTPSNAGVEVVKDSCFGFTNLNLVGSPMLSPVQKTAATPTSDYCSAILSLSEISMQEDLVDLKRAPQHSVFSGDDLEPDIALNKGSSKKYKSSKQKRAKGRYSSSKVEAWAEKVNQEFDELDNFELSIEG